MTDIDAAAPTIPDTRPGSWRVRIRQHPPVLLTALALLGAGVTVLPIVYLVDRAQVLGWDNVADELFNSTTRELLTRSLVLAGTVTALCVFIGVVAAWLVVRCDLPGRRFWSVLLTLPLAVPSYAAAYAWVSWRPSISPFTGSVLVLTLVSYPFVFLPVAASLRRLDPALEEIAQSLGHSGARVAFTLTVRQIRPAIATGGLLVALYVLSDFGAVATMRYEAFTFVIYGAYNAGFNPSRAAILALALVAVALVLVAAEAWIRGSAGHARLGHGVARPQTPVRLGRALPLAWAFLATVTFLGVAFPAWRFVTWIRQALRVDFPTDDVVGALGNSLWFSALATAATLGLAVPVGILVARHRSRATRLVERVTYIGHALPGIVVAISLVFVGVRVLRPFYQEVPLLILAYVVLFLPLAAGSVRASVEQSPVRLEEAARSLGSPPRTVLRRVTLPLAAPALAGGAALVFVTTMKELPATLLLHPTGTDTLATRLWTYTAETNYAAGAPYAAALMLFAAIPAAVLFRFMVERTGSSPT